jgi:hypothetical protein
LASGPFGFNDSVSEIGEQRDGVGAVCFVDFNAFANGNKSKNLIAGNGIAAGCEVVIEGVKVVAQQELVFFLFYFLQNFFSPGGGSFFDFGISCKFKAQVFVPTSNSLVFIEIADLLRANSPFSDAVKKVKGFI